MKIGTFQNIKLGQKVWAVVEDLVTPTSLIVNFNGDLVRVENHTDKALRTGSRIQLEVTNLNPLSFKLVESQRLSFKTKLNIDI
jgi:sulfur carrier protein ThiS